jgi:hypothetical protein
MAFAVRVRFSASHSPLRRIRPAERFVRRGEIVEPDSRAVIREPKRDAAANAEAGLDHEGATPGHGKPFRHTRPVDI